MITNNTKVYLLFLPNCSFEGSSKFIQQHQNNFQGIGNIIGSVRNSLTPHVRPPVGWLICHNLVKGREVTLLQNVYPIFLREVNQLFEQG